MWGNAVVSALSLPDEVVLAAAGSWLVYRWRPRLLVVPMVALAIVLAYHVTGWLAFGG